MSLRKDLKKQGTIRGRRWTIKRDKNDNIIDVRLIYDPVQYASFKNSKPMLGDRHLLIELEKEYEKKKNNS